jgi:hypothetical protein
LISDQQLAIGIWQLAKSKIAGHPIYSLGNDQAQASCQIASCQLLFASYTAPKKHLR